MTRVSRAQDILLYVAALGAPLGAYQFVPLVHLPLPVLATAALFPLVLWQAIREKPRLPFELWWPCALIVLVALLAPGIDKTVALWPLAFITIFLSIRTREALHRALFLLVLGAALAAVLSIAAQWGAVYPTDASLRGVPAAGVFGDAAAELVVFLSAGVVALALSLDRRLPARTRAITGGAAALILAALAHIAFRFVQAGLSSELARLTGFSAAEMATAALALWLLCRILARLVLLHRRAQASLAVPLFIAAAAGALAVTAFLPVPAFALVVFAALAARAASAFPQTETAPPHPLWMAPVLLLVAFSLCVVPLSNERDPRNYDAAAEQWLAEGRFPQLDQRLRAVSLHLDEPRVQLWRARFFLAQEDTAAAADAFVKAAHMLKQTSAQWGRFPAPTRSDFDAVLDRFRDVASSQANEVRGLSYERALVALGETDSAMASLRFRAAGKDAPRVNIDQAASDIAARLGEPSLADQLRAWPPEDLAAVCVQIGGCAAAQ